MQTISWKTMRSLASFLFKTLFILNLECLSLNWWKNRWQKQWNNLTALDFVYTFCKLILGCWYGDWRYSSFDWLSIIQPFYVSIERYLVEMKFVCEANLAIYEWIDDSWEIRQAIIKESFNRKEIVVFSITFVCIAQKCSPMQRTMPRGATWSVISSQRIEWPENSLNRWNVRVAIRQTGNV